MLAKAPNMISVFVGLGSQQHHVLKSPVKPEPPLKNLSKGCTAIARLSMEHEGSLECSMRWCVSIVNNAKCTLLADFIAQNNTSSTETSHVEDFMSHQHQFAGNWWYKISVPRIVNRWRKTTRDLFPDSNCWWSMLFWMALDTYSHCCWCCLFGRFLGKWLVHTWSIYVYWCC